MWIPELLRKELRRKLVYSVGGLTFPWQEVKSVAIMLLCLDLSLHVAVKVTIYNIHLDSNVQHII